MLNPRNFLLNLYQDDNFMSLKEQMTGDLMEALKQNVNSEKESLRVDIDRQLKDLDEWNRKRQQQEKEFKEQQLRVVREQEEAEVNMRLQLIDEEQQEIDKQF